MQPAVQPQSAARNRSWPRSRVRRSGAERAPERARPAGVAGRGSGLALVASSGGDRHVQFSLHFEGTARMVRGNGASSKSCKKRVPARFGHSAVDLMQSHSL
jgi:hypothetical protein